MCNSVRVWDCKLNKKNWDCRIYDGFHFLKHKAVPDIFTYSTLLCTELTMWILFENLYLFVCFKNVIMNIFRTWPSLYSYWILRATCLIHQPFLWRFSFSNTVFLIIILRTNLRKCFLNYWWMRSSVVLGVGAAMIMDVGKCYHLKEWGVSN